MNEFAEELHDVFERFGRISLRRMFGGHGVFHEGRMFGLIAGGRLYLKADAETAGFFEARQLPAFEYQRRGQTARISYYEAPPELFEDRARSGAVGRPGVGGGAARGRGEACCAPGAVEEDSQVDLGRTAVHAAQKQPVHPAGRPGSRRPACAAPGGPIPARSPRPNGAAPMFTFCSTISTVAPRSARLRSNLKTSCTTIGDRPIEGSSIRITLGRRSSARPISSCFCSPPDSEDAGECSRSFRRGKKSSTSGIRSWVAFIPIVMPPSSRFSNALSWPKRFRPWGTKAMPSASSAFCEAPVMSRPSKLIRPARGQSNPNKVFRTVDFPAPFGPISRLMAPAGIRNEAR